MRRIPVSLAAMLALAAGAAGCINPRGEANIAQAMNDAAAQINYLQGDITGLQFQIDSLRGVLAKQDTIIDRLVAVTHIPR